MTPTLEPLEPRCTPTAFTRINHGGRLHPPDPAVATVIQDSRGVIRIQGTGRADTVTIGTELDETTFTESLLVTVNGQAYHFATADAVVALLGAGNDVLYNDTSVDLIALGGSGRDHLVGGLGRNWLYGWQGDDFLYGYEGDVLVGGPGADFIEVRHRENY